MNDMVIYDQPLNEMIRVCLRLEQLFQQIDHQLQDMSLFGTRTLLKYIIDLLQLLDRPDLKSKLAKELGLLHANVLRYSQSPGVDADKFSHITQKLDDFSRILIDSSGKLGYRLRDIELLNSLRMHFATSGGGCSFDMPLFHYWLQQPESQRRDTLMTWLEEFSQIRQIVTLVLDLVRNNARIEEKAAVHGFYQELLDPQSNLRMIRISIQQGIEAYPEVSIGRHFFSVRFFSPAVERRPVQFTGNLHFGVAYCSV